ncbi:MAG: FecR domain-containing protein, partial [Oscillospiraceae bacterium]|nr:FecR domain-containing protein [Oscillospiraceae bacterium]
MKRMISAILALMLIACLPLGVLAEEVKASTLRLASYQGTVALNNASGKSVTPRKDLRLYSGYGVETAKESNAYISLDGTKAVKLDASGKVSIRQSGKQLEVFLDAGKLFFSVTAPLEQDESLNIRSGTMVTGIRGSFGWMTPTEMGLMHGHVTLTCIHPETGETRVTEVYSGELVYFEEDALAASADLSLLEIDFVKKLITNDAVPAIVVEEMRESSAMQELVAADVPTVDVPKLIGSLEEKRAEEAAAVEAAEEVITEGLAAQDKAIAGSHTPGTDYYFRESASEDDGGSDTPAPKAPAAPTSITTDTMDTATLQNLLNSYNQVTLTSKGGIFESITIPAGTTLTVAEGATYDNTRTMQNQGTLENRGSFTNMEGAAFNNNGALNTYGDFTN